MSASVREGLSGLFNQHLGPSCVLQFCISDGPASDDESCGEGTFFDPTAPEEEIAAAVEALAPGESSAGQEPEGTPQGAQEGAPQLGSEGAAAGAGAAAPPRPSSGAAAEALPAAPAPHAVRYLGEPLVLNTSLVSLGSEYLRRKLEAWSSGKGGGAGEGEGQGQQQQPSEAEVLNSEAELPHAQEVQPQKRQKTASGPVVCNTGFASSGLGCLKRKLGACSSCGRGGGAGEGEGQQQQPIEVLVPLSSEAELPHATEALRFIYAGRLTPGLGPEALLRVRQQAGYLGVVGCAEACDEALVAWVEADCAAVSVSGCSSNARVLEAYACHELFPQPGGTHESPSSFNRVRAALGTQLVAHIKQAVRSPLSEEAKAQLLQLPTCAVEALVTSSDAGAILASAAMQPLLQPLLLRCFRDAVDVLTSPSLRAALLKLPACALEALLSSDELTTDSESSVVLLVATWVKANPGATEQEVRGVWRHVRLSRVSRTYLFFVLPFLQGRLALTKQQLGAVMFHTAASTAEQDRLAELPDIRALGAPLPPAWVTSRTARPCGALGFVYEATWELDKDTLLASLRGVSQTGRKGVVAVKHTGGPVCAAEGGLLLCGVRWFLTIDLDKKLLWPEAAAGDGGSATPCAGTFLRVGLPAPLDRLGVAGVVSAEAEWEVHTWEGNKQMQALPFQDDVAIRLGTGRGWRKRLPLLPRPSDGPTPAAAAGDSDEALLAPWARYLGPGSKITGTITLYQPAEC